MIQNYRRLLCSLGCIVIFAFLALGSTDSEKDTYTPTAPRTSTDSYERSVPEAQRKAAEEFLRRSMETGEYQRMQKEVDDCYASGRCKD